MSWLSEFYRHNPEYRRLRVVRRTANSIHFELEPGVYQAHFQVKPIYERVTSGLWLPAGPLARAGRMAVQAARHPRAAAQLLAALPFAAVLTLQPDPTAGIDTILRESVPTATNGTNILFRLNHNSAPTARWTGLVKFNLSSIPAGSTTTARTMSLWTAQAAGGNETFVFNRVLAANSSWAEATACWNTTNGVAFWAGDAGANGGTDAGCTQSGTDYAAAQLAGFTVNSGTALGTEIAFALDQTEFETLLTTNNGIVMRHTNRADFDFYTSDYVVDTTKRPKLVVTYTPPAGGGIFNAPVTAPFRGPFG